MYKWLEICAGIANGPVDHVGEAVQVAISRRSLLEDLDNTVQSFIGGIGQVSVGERDDVIEVITRRGDKLAQREDPSLQSVGETRIGGCPLDRLLHQPVR